MSMISNDFHSKKGRKLQFLHTPRRASTAHGARNWREHKLKHKRNHAKRTKFVPVLMIAASTSTRITMQCAFAFSWVLCLSRSRFLRNISWLKNVSLNRFPVNDTSLRISVKKSFSLLRALRTDKWIVHFTVACQVTRPLNGSEAGGDLALIQTFLLYYVNEN